MSIMSPFLFRAACRRPTFPRGKVRAFGAKESNKLQFVANDIKNFPLRVKIIRPKRPERPERAGEIDSLATQSITIFLAVYICAVVVFAWKNLCCFG